MKTLRSDKKAFAVELSDGLQLTANHDNEALILSKVVGDKNQVVIIYRNEQAELMQALRFCLNSIKDAAAEKRKIQDSKKEEMDASS